MRIVVILAFTLTLLFGSVAGSEPAYAFDLGDFKKLKKKVKKIKHATGSISQPEEIKIGNSITAQLLGAAPLVDNAEVQDYVNKVGVWVAQQTERKDLPWLFGVIESDNINAFASPGGRVLITKGLFISLNSEAELAGVLGHEIAHVIAKHHINALAKNTRMDMLGDALIKKAGSDNKEKVMALVNAGTQLYARGLDKKDEFDADRKGAIYAARAGYDPFALLNVLATLDSIKSDDTRVALINQTHPPFAKRLEMLDKTIDVSLGKYANQLIVEDRFVDYQLKMFAKIAEKSK